ncbi:hypothetical protein ACI2VK_24710 [Ralstonia nicotianae]|nr:hypothetical protein [Ralstonia solanacearum]
MQNDAPNQESDQSISILRYEEQGADGVPTGRSATFAGVEFQPLGYADLLGQKLVGRVLIPLRWTGAHVLESTIPEITVEGVASGNSLLESNYSTKTIGLVNGGWLPSGLALRGGMVVFPDRCTITELAGRFHGGVKSDERGDDFLDIFGSKPIRINPAFYALEGNRRKQPSPEDVEEQWAEACRKIEAALPLAELTPEAAKHGVIGLLADTQDSMARKAQFALMVAADLRAPVSAKRRCAVWNHVLAVARECGVPKHSLVVLAALSTVCSANGASPAKRLLKPSANYTDEDAYNALADLRSLEILINIFAAYPQERTMFCTGDKNLALFWAGMRASNFAWTGKQASYTLSPVDALLPNVSPELRAAYLEA